MAINTDAPKDSSPLSLWKKEEDMHMGRSYDSILFSILDVQKL